MPTNPRWGMALDLERCTGCHACSVACKVENHVPLGHFRTKVYYLDQGTFPKITRNFLPTLCMHCEDAPCLKECPTESITRDADGVVRINAKTCEGIGCCEDACPYGAIYIDPVANVADKCDFCSNRLAHDMQPACVETCPADVFKFGDLNDPQSPVSQFKAKHKGQLVVLKESERTKPQVQFRPVEKGTMAKLEKKVPKGRNHDPFSYEIDTWAQVRSDFSPTNQRRELDAAKAAKKGGKS
jgi:tetrathionate reductase subunit B